jgi:hypothetical protein
MSISCSNIWSEGFKISNHFFDPLGCAVQKTELMRNFYKNYPLASRFVTVSSNTILGIIKVFALPFLSVIGIVVMPIMAIIKACRNNAQEAKQYLAATVFCLLAAAGAAAFIGLSGFKLPLIQGASLVVGGCAISVIIHVHRVVVGPKFLPVEQRDTLSSEQ